MSRDPSVPAGGSTGRDFERDRRQPRAPATQISATELWDAFEHAPLGIFIAEGPGRIVQANRAILRMLGWASHELVGKTFADITHPNDIQASYENIERLRSGEVYGFSMEKRYIHKRGRVVWVHVHVSRTAGSPDRVRYVVHVEDITRQMDADVALRESQERFGQMAESIEQDFWMLDLDPLRTLYSSPAATKIWGVDPQQFADHPEQIGRFVVPEDLPKFVSMFGAIGGKARECDYRIVRPDGEERWLRTRAFPVRTAAGAVYRIAGVTEDITERKRAEQEIAFRTDFQRLMAELASGFINIPVEQIGVGIDRALVDIGRFGHADRIAIFRIDPDGLQVCTTHAWYANRFDPDADGPQEWPIIDGGPFISAVRAGKVVNIPSVAALSQEWSIFREVSMARGVDSVLCIPLVTSSEVVGWLGLATCGREFRWSDDMIEMMRVTAGMFSNALERIRVEDAMRRHQAELAHVLRLGTMGQLAAGLAHELNQPLSAILNYASGCERRLSDGETEAASLREPLEKIRQQAVRAADVIRTLRGLVRKGEARREWHDINALVTEAIRFVEPDLTRSGVHLRFRPGAGLPRVHVDAAQIEQVVINLIRNAFDAVREVAVGNVREVSLVTAQSETAGVEVRVEDTGAGIDPARLNVIFDDFYTTKADGLGLGLSISRTLVGVHGGKLWAESTPGAGATFRFVLPGSV